jgi:hypothetical protein
VVTLSLVLEVRAIVAPPIELGAVTGGRRRMVPITGGTFEGRGALSEVRNRGIRHAAPEVMQKLLAGDLVDPALVYFRTTPTFETAAPDLQMLTRSIFVGTGERYPAEVVLRFFRVD